MTELEDDFLTAIELHSLDGLNAAIEAGLDPAQPIRGKSTTRWLTEMYTRSERFPHLMRVLLDRGAPLDDPRLREVLLDDAPALESRLAADPTLLAHRTSLDSAFTPLLDATLLHVAAEFQCQHAARKLLAQGADVNAKASVDANGLGGHTPIFHTVNSNRNRAWPLLELLLAAGARTDVAIPGLTWGRGFDWETTFFDLTPISYAQCGTLPQMHREELDVDRVVVALLRAAGRPIPESRNVPNRYLRK